MQSYPEIVIVAVTVILYVDGVEEESQLVSLWGLYSHLTQGVGGVVARPPGAGDLATGTSVGPVTG